MPHLFHRRKLGGASERGTARPVVGRHGVVAVLLHPQPTRGAHEAYGVEGRVENTMRSEREPTTPRRMKRRGGGGGGEERMMETLARERIDRGDVEVVRCFDGEDRNARACAPSPL